MALVMIAGPLSLHLQARRFQYIGAIFDSKFDYFYSAKVVIYGGLANLLPAPGSLIVRTGILIQHIGTKKSIYANIIAISLWISAGFLILGLTLYSAMFEIAIISAIVSGTILLTTGYLASKTGTIKVQVFKLTIIQFILTFTNVIRLWFICASVGFLVDPYLPAAISLGETVASGAGVAPGGMGISEVIAAAITHYIDYGPALGIAIAGLNRILSWLWLGIGLGVITFFEKFRLNNKE